MDRLLGDGTRLQSSIKYSGDAGESISRSMSGVYIGVVTNVIYPDSADSFYKICIEAAGLIQTAEGETVPFNHAMIVSPWQGADNWQLYAPKPAGMPDPTITPTAINPEIDPFDVLNWDGDKCLVSFVGGDVDCPIIIGFLPHSQVRTKPAMEPERSLISRFGKIVQKVTDGGEVTIKPDAIDLAKCKGNITIDLAGTTGGTITIKSKLHTIEVKDAEIKIAMASGTEIKLSDAKVEIKAPKAEVLGSAKGIARQDDIVTSNNASDAAFWSWMTTFQTALSSWVPVPQDGGAALKASLAGALSTWPTQQQGKITTFSAKVYTE